MNTTLFNVHDLILLLTSFECLVFAFIIISNKNINNLSYLLFAGLLVSHGFIALHELILWGSTFREWVLSISPNIFFIFNFSYWLDGPLLYLFVVSLFSANNRLKKQHALHFVPVIFFLLYLFMMFWLLESDVKTSLIKSYDIAYSWHYVSIDFICKTLRIIYVLLAIKLIKKQNSVGYITTPERSPWVQRILIFFLLVLAWEWLLTGIKAYGLQNSINLDVLEIIGLVDYYTMFVLVNLMIYVVVMETINKGGIKKVKSNEPVNISYVNCIEQAMKKDKLYLNPNLSFERFSDNLNIPVKELSFTINRYFNVNFYEYINQYRIEEAKQNLANEKSSTKSITEIFYNAGFNSKSVYNTLFKKMYKMTPSQYRKQILNSKKNSHSE
jgi:AraC-like DNA-binding protein